MDELIVELVDVIRQEVATFQLLLAALEREQESLLRHEVEALGSAADEQQALIEASGRREKQRTRIVGRLSALLPETPDSLTLKRLIEHVQGPHSEQLREMRETLIGLREKIRTANRHNALLIKQSMKYVDKSLQILSGNGANSGGVYIRSGTIGTSSSPLQCVLDQVV